MELLIKKAKLLEGGKLVERDLYLEDGRIVEIGTALKGRGIDAKGLIAIPGLIDAHVHMREPGQTRKEDYESGSHAAAAGGITSVITMPNVIPPTTTEKALEEVRQLAKKSIVNFGFHFGSTEDNLKEIAAVENIASVKLYLGQSTGSMMVSEQVVKKVLDRVRIVVIHAEDQSIIDRNAKEHEGEGKPAVHSLIRTKEAALSSLERFFRLQGKAKVHVAHASTADELLLAKAQKATVEVAPHHLFLTTEHYRELGMKLKVNPPVRTKQETLLLWKHLDKVDLIATDHAPHTLEEKRQDYAHAPAGLPGLQTMLPLLLDAVNLKRMSLARLVELTSKNPAQVFRIQGKGALKAGMDADLTLIDLKKEHRIKDEEQLSKCGWTPYDGWKVKGMPVMTIVGGAIAYDQGTPYSLQGQELRF